MDYSDDEGYGGGGDSDDDGYGYGGGGRGEEYDDEDDDSRSFDEDRYGGESPDGKSDDEPEGLARPEDEYVMGYTHMTHVSTRSELDMGGSFQQNIRSGMVTSDQFFDITLISELKKIFTSKVIAEGWFSEIRKKVPFYTKKNAVLLSIASKIVEKNGNKITKEIIQKEAKLYDYPAVSILRYTRLINSVK